MNHLAERINGRTPDILDNGYVIVDFDNGARSMLDLCMFAEVMSDDVMILISTIGRIWQR